jgi:hypothetical protein
VGGEAVSPSVDIGVGTKVVQESVSNSLQAKTTWQSPGKGWQEGADSICVRI